jgi:hypothetical protein
MKIKKELQHVYDRLKHEAKHLKHDAKHDAQITKDGAEQLIGQAKTWGHDGKKQLEHLVKDHGSHFSHDAKHAINQFVKNTHDNLSGVHIHHVDHHQQDSHLSSDDGDAQVHTHAHGGVAVGANLGVHTHVGSHTVGVNVGALAGGHAHGGAGVNAHAHVGTNTHTGVNTSAHTHVGASTHTGVNVGGHTHAPAGGATVAPATLNPPNFSRPTGGHGTTANTSPTTHTHPVNTGTAGASASTTGIGASATANVGGSVAVAGGTEILNWKAAKETWGCHWFPLTETKVGGDTTNNLYAKDGCLDKLDKLTGGRAREYEYEHNRIPLTEGGKSWHGHCNDAAQVSCLLAPPLHGVDMEIDGQIVHFSKMDIQGLLAMVSSGLAESVDFRGERYNGRARDLKEEPLPGAFMAALKDYAKGSLPFCMDTDAGVQVWNYAFDRVRIVKTSTPPAGFNGRISGDGQTTFYHIEVGSTGYPKQNRLFEAYQQTDQNGNVVSEGWIKTPNSNNNADFLWQPGTQKDLSDRNVWVESANNVREGSHGYNPHINGEARGLIYDIYYASRS